jgi:hypothetical protein
MTNRSFACRFLDYAKELIEYGATKDPTYYLFHYSLARFYSINGDLDKSLLYLKRQFPIIATTSNQDPIPTRYKILNKIRHSPSLGTTRGFVSR